MNERDALRLHLRSRRETAHLTRSRANLRRLRGAHAQIEAEIGRRKRGARRRGAKPRARST